MNMNILVAYGTKYGATAEIAERIGRVLKDAGHKVDVLPVDRAGEAADYGAVVLGSAVYAGSWRKEAADFLMAQEQALADRPVWFFSSGPTGEGDPVELMKGWRFPEALKPVADRVQPRDMAFFHGAIQLDKINFGEKLIVKALKAPMGDFRGWQAIEAWAGDIAEALQAPAAA
jgi:menaquinone-dependent protoporphyrinogen oxidase